MQDGNPQIVTKCYDLSLYVVPLVAKFPKNNRFSLGQRIEDCLFAALESLITAHYTKNKIQLLETANSKIQVFRFLMRMCKDLDLISIQKYEHVTKLIVELGKMVGGWIKQQK